MLLDLKLSNTPESSDFMNLFVALHHLDSLIVFDYRPTVMMELVFGDSRCRRLHRYLTGTNILVYFYPGATLEQVVLNAIPIIRRRKPTSILLMGGVNDLTILHHQPRRTSLRFFNEGDMVNAVMSSIVYLRGLLLAEFPDLSVSFGGLIGFDLNAINGIPGYSPLQEMITAAFIELNSAILSNNVAAGAPHFYLTSKVYKWRKGRLRCQYRLLPDGLHPGPIILQDWANSIKKIWDRYL